MIRIATEEDAERITNAQIASWTEAYKHFIPQEFFQTLSVEARSRRWRELLAARGEKVYVFEESGDLGGFVHFRSKVTIDGETIGEIERLYLVPGYWGQGIGKKLLHYALRELEQMGSRRVELWVAEENTRARKFYEAHGFCQTNGRRADRFSVDGVHLLPDECPDVDGVINPVAGEFLEVSYCLKKVKDGR